MCVCVLREREKREGCRRAATTTTTRSPHRRRRPPARASVPAPGRRRRRRPGRRQRPSRAGACTRRAAWTSCATFAAASQKVVHRPRPPGASAPPARARAGIVEGLELDQLDRMVRCARCTHGSCRSSEQQHRWAAHKLSAECQSERRRPACAMRIGWKTPRCINCGARGGAGCCFCVWRAKEYGPREARAMPGHHSPGAAQQCWSGEKNDFIQT